MQIPPASDIRARTRESLWRYSPALLIAAYWYFQFSEPWYFRLPLALFGGLVLQVFGLLAYLMAHYAVQRMQGVPDPEFKPSAVFDTHSVAALLVCAALWVFLLIKRHENLRQLGECMDEYQVQFSYQHERPSELLADCRAEESQADNYDQ